MANSVKWAIESATRISCLYRDGQLLAEAKSGTAKELTEIAKHIAGSFTALIDQFCAIDGVNVKDRGVFVMGLYDGMMNETRSVEQRLPSRAVIKKSSRSKKGAAACAPALNIQPYTIGLSLGKQIRFSAPREQITAELQAVTQQQLAS